MVIRENRGSEASPRAIDRRGAFGKEWTQAPGLALTPAAGRIGLPRWPPSTLARTRHLASEGTRTEGPSAATCLALLSQTRSARKMLGPSLGRHAQASERVAAGPSLGARAATYRRRRESEGRFLRHQGLTEEESTLAFPVTTAPSSASFDQRSRRAGAVRAGCAPGARWRAPWTKGSAAPGRVFGRPSGAGCRWRARGWRRGLRGRR